MVQFLALLDFPKWLRQLFFMIDKMIYEWIGYIYDFLIELAKLRIFDENHNYGEILELMNNFYMIIGIFILFKIVFTLIVIISNPERAFSEKFGTAQFLLPRVMITLALIIMLPTFYNWLYEFQRIVLDKNIIPRIFNAVLSDETTGEEIEVNDERCVLKFETPPEYKFVCDSSYWLHERDLGDIPSDKVIGCKPSGSPFNGITSNIYGRESFDPTIDDPDTITFAASGITIGYRTVVDLKSNKVYFIPDGSDNMADYENMNKYTNNILNPTFISGYENISLGLNCKQFAILELTNSSYPFSYEIKFYDKRPTELNENQELLTKTTYLMIFSDRYALTAGRDFASSILGSFASPTDKMSTGDRDNYINAVKIANYVEMERYIEKRVDDVFVIRYFYIISTVFGAIILLLLASTCFDIAKRVIALAFLQVIAPIPISTYVEKGSEGPFGSYIKILTSVYLDVFIRVAALSFAMFMLRYLNAFDMEQFLMANDLLDKGVAYNWLIKLFLIFGAFMFIKDVPNLLAKILNIDANGLGSMMELNPLKKLEQVPVAGAIAGTAIGSVAGAWGRMTATAGGRARDVVNAVRAGRGDELAASAARGFWEGGLEPVIKDIKNRGAKTTFGQGYARGFTSVGESIIEGQQRNIKRQQDIINSSYNSLSGINEKYNIGIANSPDATIDFLNSKYNDINNQLLQAQAVQNPDLGLIGDLSSQLGEIGSAIGRASEIKQDIAEAEGNIKRAETVMKRYSAVKLVEDKNKK